MQLRRYVCPRPTLGRIRGVGASRREVCGECNWPAAASTRNPLSTKLQRESAFPRHSTLSVEAMRKEKVGVTSGFIQPFRGSAGCRSDRLHSKLWICLSPASFKACSFSYLPSARPARPIHRISDCRSHAPHTPSTPYYCSRPAAEPRITSIPASVAHYPFTSTDL